MAQFLLILRDDPSDFASFSPEQFQALIGKYMAWSKGLSAEKRQLAGQKLAGGGAVLGRRAGKVVVTDGPFGEAKEVVGGYYLIEAKDLNEAILVASRIPGAVRGCVEVRPIAEDEQTRRILAAGKGKCPNG